MLDAAFLWYLNNSHDKCISMDKMAMALKGLVPTPANLGMLRKLRQ